MAEFFAFYSCYRGKMKMKTIHWY